MTRRMERAQLLNRLCELRELYKRRGPDDREASVTVESLLDHLAKVWDHARPPRGDDISSDPLPQCVFASFHVIS